jgi:hypothetical protein
MDSARACYREQYALAREVGGPAEIGNAAFNLGHVVVAEEPTLAREAVEAAAEAFAAAGDIRGLTRLESVAALQRIFAAGPQEMEHEMRSLHDRFVALDDLMYASIAANTLAWIRMLDGDPRGALRWAVMDLRYAEALRDWGALAIALSSYGAFALAVDRPDACALLLGAAKGRSERYGVRPPIDLIALVDAPRPDVSARGLLGDGPYETAFAEGERMTEDQILQLIRGVAIAEGIEIPA